MATPVDAPAFRPPITKFPIAWTGGKAHPGRSAYMEKVRREKIRDGEDQRGKKSEERRCRPAKR